MPPEAEVLEREDASTALVVPTEQTALQVLTDKAEFEAFYSKIEAIVAAHEPDVSTSKGRKEIAALAFKVTKTKTGVDEARKKLTEEARKKVDAANAAGKVIWDRLEALAAKARKPLTEWEAAEKVREEKVRTTIDEMRAAAVISLADTPDSVAARLMRVESIEITADVFQDYEAAALATQKTTIETLTAGHARLVQEAADRAELAALRQAESERLAKAAAEAEEKAREEAAAVAAKIAAEVAERHQLDEIAREARAKAEAEKAAKAAAEAATRAAEAKAKAEAEAKEKAHADELAAEKRRADEADAARKAAADRVAKAAAAARAAAQAEAEEKRRREADIAHRSEVIGTAGAALVSVCSVDRETAASIVTAIAAGLIPAVSISF